MAKRKKKPTKLQLSFLSIGLAIVSAILHNAIYGIFGVEEAVFFLLTLFFLVLFPLFLVLAIVEFLRSLLKKRK